MAGGVAVVVVTVVVLPLLLLVTGAALCATFSRTLDRADDPPRPPA